MIRYLYQPAWVGLLALVLFTMLLATCGRMDNEPSSLATEAFTPEGDEYRSNAITGKKYAQNSLDRIATLYAPYLEWSLENTNFSGNPFDILATVTFTHHGTGETRQTLMYYDGDNIWKFRFTATRTGMWTFTTDSGEEDLSGKSGSITVPPNPNPAVAGFLLPAGNKFARQVGENGELEAFLFHVYQDNLAFPANYLDLRHEGRPNYARAFRCLLLSCGFQNPLNCYRFCRVQNWQGRRGLDYIRDYPAERWAMQYLQAARSHGSDVLFIALAHQWLKAGALSYHEHNSENPDPLTFDMLERIITTVHEQGGHLHIWMWGDEQRKWTPIGLPGGINGEVDRRLQRYIAARLGPLPGWSMSYGFDLFEWVTTDQVESWAAYMQQHLGWPRLLAAREEDGFRTPDTLQVFSYDARPSSGFYENAVGYLKNASNRPVLLERRFYYGRDGIWDMDTTRRAMWQFTLAGGVGSLWGIHQSLGAGPYPNPEQLATHRQFWKDRFLLNMERANHLTDGYALKSDKENRLVFYKEGTSSIRIDLSSIPAPQPAVAVDTKTEYAEIYLGFLAPMDQTWNAPYPSDWAIAVGFSR